MGGGSSVLPEESRRISVERDGETGMVKVKWNRSGAEFCSRVVTLTIHFQCIVMIVIVIFLAISSRL